MNDSIGLDEMAREYEDAHEANMKLVKAEDIMATSNNIATFAQLHTFIKACQQGAVQVQMQLHNPQRTTLFVNAAILVPLLVQTFQEIGQGLEANNVDLSSFLNALEENYQRVYEGGQAS